MEASPATAGSQGERQKPGEDRKKPGGPSVTALMDPLEEKPPLVTFPNTINQQLCFVGKVFLSHIEVKPQWTDGRRPPAGFLSLAQDIEDFILMNLKGHF